MKPKPKQTLYRNVAAFFAAVFLFEAIALSFATRLLSAPIVCFTLSIFFYGVLLLAQRLSLTSRWLVGINAALALGGLLQLFTLHDAGAPLFWMALLPLAMYIYYVPRWSASIAVLYAAAFAAVLFIPSSLTGIKLDTIDVKASLLLLLVLPILLIPLVIIRYESRKKEERVQGKNLSENEMLNAIAGLFYHIRTSLNSLQGAAQMLKGEEAIDKKQQKEIRSMLDKSIVALNDIVNSLFVTKSLTNEQLVTEQFNLHANIKNRVTVQFASLGLDDTPSFSFDPSVPQLVEGDAAYADQAIERILGGILYDNLLRHEPLHVSSLVLGAPQGDSLLVKVEFECGNLSSQIISDDSLFNDTQGAFLGSLRIRRAAHGVSASFTMPLTVVTKARRYVDVVEVAKLKTPAAVVRGSDLLANARLLIVEDNAINRRVMKITLQNVVASLTLAEDGREAVEMVKENSYDIILMDVQMPIMDGYAATQAIRAMERERGGHVPIIALTAYALRGDRERCLAVGMDTYIAKPFQKEALLTIMTRELAKAHRNKA